MRTGGNSSGSIHCKDRLCPPAAPLLAYLPLFHSLSTHSQLFFKPITLAAGRLGAGHLCWCASERVGGRESVRLNKLSLFQAPHGDHNNSEERCCWAARRHRCAAS